MANFEQMATPVVGVADFVVLSSTPSIPVAAANTLVAVAVLLNKKETPEVPTSEIEQIVDALAVVAAGKGLVTDGLYGWHHYFQQDDYRFVDSNSYYS